MSNTRSNDASPITPGGRRASVASDAATGPAPAGSMLADHLTIPLAADKPMQCPRCGSDAGLRFDEVSLIDPAGDVLPLHAEGGEGLSIVAAVVGNRSIPERRHMIVLPHWCTACGERAELVLRQEGGQTFGEYRESRMPAVGPQEASSADSSGDL